MIRSLQGDEVHVGGSRFFMPQFNWREKWIIAIWNICSMVSGRPGRGRLVRTHYLPFAFLLIKCRAMTLMYSHVQHRR